MRNFIIFLLLFFSIITYISAQTINQEWTTYSEKSNYTGTPTYNETISYLKKIEAATPYIKLISFGKSPQGRKLYAHLYPNKNFLLRQKSKK